jgi:hypothetical protein
VILNARRRRFAFVSLLAATAASTSLALAGCAGAAPTDGEYRGDGDSATVDATSGTDPAIATRAHSGLRKLPTDAGFDYQLGGAYTPPKGVSVVGRDRTSNPLKGGYSICYVNAFQTQPGDAELWKSSLLLKVNGKLVKDPDWPDETLLDTSTKAKRQGILKVLKPWIKGCADKGYSAVEFDNLDSYTRSHQALRYKHNAALAEELVKAAHSYNLMAAQKNVAERSADLQRSAGFDMAVAEECAANEECGEYTRTYGSQVVDTEYTDNLPVTFTRMCQQARAPKLMILRDRDLLTPGKKGYVYKACSR